MFLCDTFVPATRPLTQLLQLQAGSPAIPTYVVSQASLSPSLDEGVHDDTNPHSEAAIGSSGLAGTAFACATQDANVTVFWRILYQRRVLELRSDSPATTVGTPPALSACVHLAFDSPLLPGTTVEYDPASASLVVLAATSSGTIVRAFMPVPVAGEGFHNPWRTLDPSFASSYPAKLLKSRDPRVVHFPDIDTCAVACDDGVVVLVDFPRVEDASVSEYELAEPRTSLSSALKSLVNTPMKLLGGWTSSSSTPAHQPPQSLAFNPCYQPIAFTSVKRISTGSIFLIALCRDKKLRVFNTVTVSHIQTVPVFHSPSGESGAMVADSASHVASSVTSIASKFTNLGLVSNSAGNGLSKGFGDVAFDAATLDQLIPSNDSDLTQCNHLKIFGQKMLPNGVYQFKIAVYVGPGAGVAFQDESGATNDSFACGSFSVFEGGISEKGALVHLYNIGIKAGPSLNVAQGEMLKDFSVLPDAACNIVEPTSENDIDIEDDLPLPSEEPSVFKLWVSVCNSSHVDVNPTEQAIMVKWSDLEIAPVEDKNGKRVRRAGFQGNLGGRWLEAVSTRARLHNAAKSGYPQHVEVAFKSLPPTVSGGLVYADFVFESCRFSTNTILQAIEVLLSRAVDSKQSSLTEFYDSIANAFRSNVIPFPDTQYVETSLLKDFLLKALGNLSITEKSHHTERRANLSKNWSTFLGICREISPREDLPYSLAVNMLPSGNSGFPSPKFYLLRRGGTSVLRPMDPPEIVQAATLSTGVSFPLLAIVPQSYFTTTSLKTHKTLADVTLRVELANFFNLSKAFHEAYGDESVSLFLDAVLAQASSHPITGTVETSILLPFAKQYFGGRLSSANSAFTDALVKQIYIINDFPEFLDRLVAVFDINHGVASDATDIAGDNESVSWSGILRSLFVETMLEIVDARRRLIEDIVLVTSCTLLLAEGDAKLKELFAATAAFRSTLVKVVGAFLSCAVAQYVARSAVIVHPGGDTNNSDDINGMEIEDDGKVSFKTPLSLFILQRLCPRISSPDSGNPSAEGQSSFLVEASYAVMQKLGLFNSASSSNPESTSSPYDTLRVTQPMLNSVLSLVKMNQEQSALKILGFFIKDTHCLQHLDAYVKLKCGDYESAKDGFTKAANEFIRPLDSLDKMWCLLVDENVLSGGLVSYYQYVMRLFEEVNVHKIVAGFAKLALDAMTEADKRENADLAQTLWKKMFKHSLEGQEFEAAYIYLSANADVDVRKYSIRSFTTALCESHQVEALCMRYNFGKLQKEVEDTLLFKAKTRKVVPIPSKNGDPNYHKILYSYYTTRGDHRNASWIMYDYACRLNSVSSSDIGGGSLSEIVTEQARSYLASINSLSLVQVEYQWLLYELSLDDTFSSDFVTRKRRRVSLLSNDPGYGNEPNGRALAPKKQEIIHLDDIRKEYALALAKLSLAERYNDLAMSSNLPDPNMAVYLLSREGKFDQALRLAKIFDESLIEGIFGDFGSRCVLLCSENARSVDGKPLIENAPVDWEGSAGEKAWMALQIRLEEFKDNEPAIASYRKAIARKCLETSVDYDLPLWLVEGFKKGKGEDLIRLYLKHGLHKKACTFAIEFIRDRMKAFPEYGDKIRPSHNTRWISFSALDQLQQGLEQQLHGKGIAEMRESLSEAVQEYVSRMHEETQLFAAGGVPREAAGGVRGHARCGVSHEFACNQFRAPQTESIELMPPAAATAGPSAASLHHMIHQSATHRQTQVSLKQMVEFGVARLVLCLLSAAADSRPPPLGRAPSQYTILRSAKFLHHELPIRLARRVVELESLPYGLSKMASVRKVADWYSRSYEDLIKFPSPEEAGIDREMMKEVASAASAGAPLDEGSTKTVTEARRVDCPPKHKLPEAIAVYNSKFVECVENIKRRHDPVAITMAQGIQELKQLWKDTQTNPVLVAAAAAAASSSKGNHEAAFRPTQPSLYPPINILKNSLAAQNLLPMDLQSFLDRFYLSRIGIRMLIGQHVALSKASVDGSRAPQDYVGIICTRTSIRDVVTQAAENAQSVLQDSFGVFDPPAIKLVIAGSSDAVDASVDDIEFMYVPSHLHHMLFELFKNSLRAIVEKYGMDADGEYPPIKVIVAQGHEDITIKISDEGGGIPRSGMPLIWTYMYTTAEKTDLDEAGSGGFRAPMAGFGYGLPLSRLYARYFGGDLKLISMEGYGTDAYLHLNRLSDSEEPLPY
ncbi:hypothetical protein HDU82_008167 [Entophlyctis luteolus]|nr:hypothetical protein HDU82_008167 [Entophlyctis luteolus]